MWYEPSWQIIQNLSLHPETQCYRHGRVVAYPKNSMTATTIQVNIIIPFILGIAKVIFLVLADSVVRSDPYHDLTNGFFVACFVRKAVSDKPVKRKLEEQEHVEPEVEEQKVEQQSQKQQQQPAAQNTSNTNKKKRKNKKRKTAVTA